MNEVLPHLGVTIHSPLGLAVVPAQAGIHAWEFLDSRLRGNDDQIEGVNGYVLVLQGKHFFAFLGDPP